MNLTSFEKEQVYKHLRITDKKINKPELNFFEKAQLINHIDKTINPKDFSYKKEQEISDEKLKEIVELVKSELSLDKQLTIDDILKILRNSEEFKNKETKVVKEEISEKKITEIIKKIKSEIKVKPNKKVPTLDEIIERLKTDNEFIQMLKPTIPLWGLGGGGENNVDPEWGKIKGDITQQQDLMNLISSKAQSFQYEVHTIENFGQTSFTLNYTPSEPTTVSMIIANGTEIVNGVSFSVSENIATYSLEEPKLEVGEKIIFKYFKDVHPTFQYEVHTVTVLNQTIFELNYLPDNELNVSMIPVNGTEIINGYDFEVNGQIVTYLSQTPNLEVGEKIIFKYFKLS